ncbi:TRAP transporter small permease [Jannaschia aquimarina]|uniref:TRAP transporter small permease protein n=1 Tax=Jannaschia aquimarina TaxID=935700 RepID=A0A0D1CLN8_9RHOB|nr:TRAP transporter small permease subunit [Jannaschia aquimarina]KIT15702.1 Tripartite ATP-independent periplasmic transporter, DctQ component [Jannaschia aquimarina]SNT38956.1 TRAP-type C4-dicarboxylate transport system, small permease component [Jannaschia aquimarina]
MEIFGGMGEIISALFGNDAWMLADALRANAPSAWVLGLLITLLGGYLTAQMYRHVPLTERYLEPTVMVVSYLAIGAIIFSGVIQRFGSVPDFLVGSWLGDLLAPYLAGQPSWSTTLPPFLFLVMTWVGCSWNVKLRTHLAFAEFRTAMPRGGQFACLVLDAVLWLGFAWIVIVTAGKETVNAASNFRIMLGTDNVMQWWFLISVPLAWILLSGRVIENLMDDVARYRSGGPMIERAVIGGDA